MALLHPLHPSFRRPSAFVAAVAVIVVAFGAGVAAGAENGVVDAAPDDATVVAVQVGDTPIYQAELDVALRRVALGRFLDAERRLQLAAETVEQLVDERLLKREVDARGISIDEDEVSEIVTRMRGQLAARKIPIETFLAQSGRDETSLRSQLRLELALNKLVLPQITSATINAAYTKHRRDLDGTLVRASHIIFRPDPGRGDEAVNDMEQRAAALRTEILRGEVSFAEAARRHSAGPSRRQGGDIGYFPRHGAMDEEFSRQSFALAKGEISKPFITPFGVHLVMITDVKPGDVRPDELRPQLEKIVLRDAIREIVERGRRDTAIEYTPGVPHFASASDRDNPARRVVVTSGGRSAP